MLVLVLVLLVGGGGAAAALPGVAAAADILCVKSCTLSLVLHCILTVPYVQLCICGNKLSVLDEWYRVMKQSLRACISLSPIAIEIACTVLCNQLTMVTRILCLKILLHSLKYRMFAYVTGILMA